MKSVGIAMGSPRWNFLFCCFVLSNLQPTRANKPVFQAQFQAAIFLRSRRANSWLPFEEIHQGNLEKECYEERCNKEEAREYFENDLKTEAFWTVYYDGDQCSPNPCQNGGTCVDRIGGYTCRCTELYVGPSCERDISQCPANGPHACEHFCSPTYGAYTCHCAQGYTLHPDRKRCVPHVKHPCGRIPHSTSRHKVPNHRRSGDEICPQGHCPWQVTLVSRSGEPVCNGVILGPRAVLTTATCMSSNTDITHVHIGHHSPGSRGIRLPLEAVPTTHSRYKLGHQGHDLCFLQLNSSIPLGVSAIPLCLPEKDFSENILMQDDQEGLISSGRVRHSYVSLHDCRNHLNLSFTLSNKMFCMKESNLGTEHKEEGQEHPPREGQKLHTVQAGRSSQITPKNRLRPRTQRPVWVTEGDLIEYTEDVLLLSEVQKSTAQIETPTEQTSGASPTEQTSGASPTEQTSGASPTEQTSGASPTEQTSGASPTEHTSGASPTEQTSGASPTEQTSGASPDEQTSQASPTQKGTLEPTVGYVDSTKMEKSPPTVKGRGDCGLLPGTPVASVKGKTAFVTGLMLSHDCSQGLVFTKLSRFLPWLESLLELKKA